MQDTAGWTFKKTDGSYSTNEWERINGSWYYFGGAGYMVTGWKLVGGKYYYFDVSGAMLANTTTPDGYKVDASGAWIQ